MNKGESMTIHDPFGKGDVEIEFTKSGFESVRGVKDNPFPLSDQPVSSEMWEDLHE